MILFCFINRAGKKKRVKNQKKKKRRTLLIINQTTRKTAQSKDNFLINFDLSLLFRAQIMLRIFFGEARKCKHCHKKRVLKSLLMTMV